MDASKLKSMNINPFEVFCDRWALLTSGTIDDYNSMTISWGSLGAIWGDPFGDTCNVTCYVKPIRHTFGYLERCDIFTVSFYPESMRGALEVMGEKSGRDCDKAALAGLVPREFGGSVTFEGAELTLACRKLYHAAMHREDIPASIVRDFYTPEEPHHIFIGTVLDFEGSL